MTHVCPQESRITKLEEKQTNNSKEIDRLVTRLDNLIKGVWALVLVLIPSVVTAFGFLIKSLFIAKGWLYVQSKWPTISKEFQT